MTQNNFLEQKSVDNLNSAKLTNTKTRKLDFSNKNMSKNYPKQFLTNKKA